MSERLAGAASLLLLLGCGPVLQTARRLAENGQIQDDAPVKAELQSVVKAPIETVWNVFSDVEAWPTWNPDARGAHFEGPFVAGTAFSYGTRTQHHLTLAEVVPPNRVSFYGTYLGYIGITVWEFLALSPRETRVRVRESSDGLMISIFYGSRQLEEHLQGWLTRLKVEAERPTATPQ